MRLHVRYRLSSTETIISSANTDEDTGERLGQKRNRQNNKAARYESHKKFLEKCIQEKLIPEGLRLQLEPAIGNYDDFLHDWYVKLETFSLELITDVVEFCNKTLATIGKSIKEIEAELKIMIDAKEFASVRETIALKKEETSKALEIRKKANTITLNTDDPYRAGTLMQVTLKTGEAGAKTEAPHAEIIFSKNKEVMLR